MTLALIILFTLSGNVLGVPRLAAGQSEQPSTQQAPAGSQVQPQDQAGQRKTAPNTQPSASTPPQTSSPQPKAPVKRPRHKKKVVAQNCDSSTTSPASSSQTSGTQATSGQNAQTPCPPPKTVVRHGGTSEPSIQLAGDQPPKERDDTNQLLNLTNANLKKLEGRQLSANQQDMVGQVRQFMEQSRSAMAAGDFARSRTLAWKAQLLSEELVKPPK